MLAAHREQGLLFDLAWKKAWRRVVWPHDTLHRNEWKEVLQEQKEAWRACYDRRHTPEDDYLEDTFTALMTAA